MSRLPKSQVCPIHRSKFCCGRESKESRRRTPIRGPVTKIPDAHHPRGYIEVCSPAEIRRRLIIKMRQQVCICGICGLPIFEFSDAVADHIEPNPAGCKKDSHMDNLQAAHKLCNLAKGSQRLEPKMEKNAN